MKDFKYLEDFTSRKGKTRKAPNKKELVVKRYHSLIKSERKTNRDDESYLVPFNPPLFVHTEFRLALKDYVARKNVPGLQEAVDAASEVFCFASENEFNKATFRRYAGRHGDVNKCGEFWLSVPFSEREHQDDYFDEEGNFNGSVKLVNQITKYEYSRLSEDAKKFFTVGEVDEKKAKELGTEPYFICRPNINPSFLKIVRRKFYYNSYKVINTDVYKKNAEIDDFIYKNSVYVYGRKANGWEPDWNTERKRVVERTSKKEVEEFLKQHDCLSEEP